MKKFYYHLRYTIEDEVDCSAGCNKCPHTLDIDRDEYVSLSFKENESIPCLDELLRAYIVCNNGEVDKITLVKHNNIKDDISDITNDLTLAYDLLSKKRYKEKVSSFAKDFNISFEEALNKLRASEEFRVYCLGTQF